MKIIHNKLIPFGRYDTINIFGILFTKSKSLNKYVINHESIHTEQMKEMGYIFFYIWYFIEWLIRLIINGRYAYYYLSFEREAFDNEKNYKYLNKRKPYSWFKYYGK